MYHYFLMSDGLPPEQLKGHAYATPREALAAAQIEADRRRQRIQIHRVTDLAIESQPWQVIDPVPLGESDVREWYWEGTIKGDDATLTDALDQAATRLRERLATNDVRAHASNDVLIVRITVIAPTEDEASARAFDLVDAALDDVGPSWARRKWAGTQVRPVY